MRMTSILIGAWSDLNSRSRLRCGYALIVMLMVTMVWSVLAARTAELERKRDSREAVLKDLLTLKTAYFSAKMIFDQRAGKMATLQPDDSLSRIIDEIGIKGKGVKIAPLKSEERLGGIEDSAEVRIEGLTANEMVNLVFHLEKGSRPVSLKKADLRVRFDDPSRFDLTMTLALLKPVPGKTR